MRTKHSTELRPTDAFYSLPADTLRRSPKSDCAPSNAHDFTAQVPEPGLYQHQEPDTTNQKARSHTSTFRTRSHLLISISRQTTAGKMNLKYIYAQRWPTLAPNESDKSYTPHSLYPRTKKRRPKQYRATPSTRLLQQRYLTDQGK